MLGLAYHFRQNIDATNFVSNADKIGGTDVVTSTTLHNSCQQRSRKVTGTVSIQNWIK